MMERRGCSCFGRVAMRIGLIDQEQLDRARAARGLTIAEALVRMGDLTPQLAARVYEVLAAGHACRHKSRGAA